MTFHFDITNNRLSLTRNGPAITKVTVPSGSDVPVVISLYDTSGTVIPSATGFDMGFGLTDPNASDATLAEAVTWTNNGSGRYSATLDTNTSELIAALGTADTLVVGGQFYFGNTSLGMFQSQVLDVTVERSTFTSASGTPSGLASPDAYVRARAVVYDAAQTLTSGQKAQAAANIGIEAGADVTDTENVRAAGAVMLDQTTPQSITGGIPLMDVETSAFDDPSQLVNKRYVDDSINLTANYFYSDTPDAIGGIYYQMTASDMGEAESNLSTGTLTVGDDQPVFNFINDIPLGITVLNAGIYNTHIHASKTGTRTVSLYCSIYFRDSGGTETLVGTSLPSALTTTPTEYVMAISVPSAVTITATDKLVVKFFANIGAAGNGSIITLRLEDDADSRITIPIESATLNQLFVRQDETSVSPSPDTVVRRDGDGGIVMYVDNGNAGDFSANSGNAGVFTSNTGIAGILTSATNAAISATSTAGTYHAQFGDDDSNRAFVARVNGAFGWHRGDFTGQVSAADTLTADRTYTMPDASGTVALTSDITTELESIVTSPGIFLANNGGTFYLASSADFDSNALNYITATGLTGEAAFAIDDVVKMLKGSASSTSRRGSTWTTLSTNRYTNAKGIYLLQSTYNHGTSTVVRDLKATMNLTIAGGMAWNSAGFSFDGVDDQLVGTGAHITSGQWSCMAVGKMTGASNGVVVSQNNGGNFRTTFLAFTPTLASTFRRVDPTSYSTLSTTPSTVKNSFLSVQSSTDIKIYGGGSETAQDTIALAATTIESSTFTIGNIASGGSPLKGDLQLVILWAEDISTDYSEIHANLNALLGLGL